MQHDVGMIASRQHNPEWGAEALDWAASQFSFSAAKLLRDSPWARTYRLSQGAERAYLKILPRHQQTILRPTVLLARHFPGSVPSVIACEHERCWILSADHHGHILSYDALEARQCKLLASYARIQAKAVKLPELLASLKQPDLESTLTEFWDFLQPASLKPDNSQRRVHAEYFIGRSEAKRYFRLLHRAHSLLARHLQPATKLPFTVCHNDLRPPNAALGPDGGCILCDWDDATAGPAGLSLHGMFSGCTKPTVLLAANNEVTGGMAGDRYQQRLEVYIATLVGGGYADHELLYSSLPAAVCAGVMQYLLNFANYPRDSRSYRKAVERSLTRRLDDLLNLCDLLAARNRRTAQAYVRHYKRDGQHRRAQYVLKNYLSHYPGDGEAQATLARVLRRRGKNQAALESYRDALKLVPDQADLHDELGAMLVERLEIEAARAHFSRALDIDPGRISARKHFAHATELLQTRCQARASETVPQLAYTDKEVASGRIDSGKLALAVSLFKTYGVLQIDNVFPVAMVQRLHDAFLQRYTDYFRKHDHPDALRLGDQRYMLTVDLDAPFSDPGLYASPLILPIFSRLLGDDCVIGAYTSVISLPGAKNQSLHKDAPALFPATQWQHSLPHFCVQLIVPLVALDTVVGTTRVYKGSHTVPLDKARSLGAQDPVVPLGSCLLTDYRLAHRGLGNRSDKVRPILTVIFNRPWYRDPINYSRQPPLRISDSQYQQIPQDHRKLFRWWLAERKM